MWEKLFQEHILARGMDYSIREFLEITEQTEEKIVASVYGTEEYTVEITKENDEITALTCTCPHADAGNNCKHMAAVLFTSELEQTNDIEERKEDIIELIEATDTSLIIDFLIDTLSNNENLFANFKSKISQNISKKDIKYYKNLIIDIFNDYTNDYDFINYSDAWNFISELEYVLDKDIQNMIENNHLEAAFELTNFILVEISSQSMDDSAGGMTTIAESCLENWKEIISKASTKFKRKMFNWFIGQLNQSVNDYIEEYLIEILFNNFYELEFLDKKLIYLDEQINKYKQEEEDSWLTTYKISEFTIHRLKIMERINVSATEIEKYCIENLEFNKVRQYFINRCIDNKDYSKAIQLLKDGKSQDGIYIGEREYYIVKLKDLYKFLGEEALYEKELRELLIDYQIGGIESYKELRELYSEEEWAVERDKVLKKLADQRDIDKFYAFEGLYDRLLEVVENSYGISKLIEYEAMLEPLYPKELLSKYENIVEDMATESLGRKHYKNIVSILRRMITYPEGKAKVLNIVDQWKLEYRNRPAMMDELSKLI